MLCPVTVTYDPHAQAAYVRLGVDRYSVRQQQLGDLVIIDYGEDGRVIGVELLGVVIGAVTT